MRSCQQGLKMRMSPGMFFFIIKGIRLHVRNENENNDNIVEWPRPHTITISLSPRQDERRLETRHMSSRALSMFFFLLVLNNCYDDIEQPPLHTITFTKTGRNHMSSWRPGLMEARDEPQVGFSFLLLNN